MVFLWTVLKALGCFAFQWNSNTKNASRNVNKIFHIIHFIFMISVWVFFFLLSKHYWTHWSFTFNRFLVLSFHRGWLMRKRSLLEMQRTATRPRLRSGRRRPECWCCLLTWRPWKNREIIWTGPISCLKLRWKAWSPPKMTLAKV